MLFVTMAFKYRARSGPASEVNACQFVSISATDSRAARYSVAKSEYNSGRRIPFDSARRAPAARCSALSGVSMCEQTARRKSSAPAFILSDAFRRGWYTGSCDGSETHSRGDSGRHVAMQLLDPG